MPILQQNDAAAVARYTEFVTRSPWGNLMQDRGWAHVKKGWVGEQVYLEQNGEITAAMSIIFAPAVAGRTLAYAPRGPVCDPYDTETIAALMREAAPALKKHRAFLLRFDPETPYTDELIAKYEKLGLRCRARNCGLHDQIQPRFNMFLPLEGILSDCGRGCACHIALRRNLLAETASKFWQLRQRVVYLTEPQLRRRILLFLRDRREETGSDYFRLPYSRQEMAEMLGVNRSALSRELGRMQREGLLEFYRSSFRLKEGSR